MLNVMEFAELSELDRKVMESCNPKGQFRRGVMFSKMI
jgi:hypothetical protein